MKRQETVYVCDNPNCQRRVMTEDPTEDSLPKGWHITYVNLITESGGTGTEDVYACSEECVVPAMWAKIKEDA